MRLQAASAPAHATLSLISEPAFDTSSHQPCLRRASAAVTPATTAGNPSFLSFSLMIRWVLFDPITGECLPAAMLPYCGRTLLESLIRDVQAREFLHSTVFGKQCMTLVAIMTSSVRNNREHISSLCEKHGWFGRGQQEFRLIEQPMVPVVVAEDACRQNFLPIQTFSVLIYGPWRPLEQANAGAVYQAWY